ncbi:MULTISPECIES: type IV secretory system conjugative DNA transfer family protein [Actinosynnema]|uniref:type IV secretory system conjugative DNA transfer family protein n=1 Tax=Actinosynnema TaxID=40566 RepID=UPI0020A428B4|nr:TraM recognition domain-containing protein [Actinosynnema pretiosum]MCP2097503.1 Type IV secretory pathway, VirD4 component, TraG/TraD family ATPase [Actinosynnema pretiosum]
MRNTVSVNADRDLALMGLLVAALGLLVTVAAVLMVAAAATTALFGGPWAVPAVDNWPAGVFGVLAHPARPGSGLGEPWAQALAGRTGWYWTITTALLAAATTLVLTVAVAVWRRFGPSQPGHASREDIRQELSLAAARRTAEWTRPGLPRAQALQAPLDEVAAPLHLSPQRRPMCTPLENPTGTLAPTQSGKSRRDLVHKAIAAPGALLCSTTKPDLLEFSALLRAARHPTSPVKIADVTGAVPWPAQVQWWPAQGCEDIAVAYRRAHTMVEAASVGLAGVGGNDKVFRDRAKVVLQAYFLAAAIHHRGIDDLVRWSMSKPIDQEPVRLLQQAGLTEYARNLRAEIGMVAETSDAVWMSVRRVIEPAMDPQIRRLCSPAPGNDLDVRTLIAQHGSLYLIAGQHQAAQAAPILTALVEHWLTTAQEMALHTPHRRLDPPATAILDELTNATPVPQLPDIVSDSAGRGVLIHWGAQSVAALESAFTPQRTRQLLDNTTTLSVWGGIKDRTTLEWVSLLTGHHDRRRVQQQNDGLFGHVRTSVGVETVPTYRPGDVRRVRRGRVLVIHRHLDPILARTLDVRGRPDWKQIREHVRAVRDGHVPIGTDGLAVAPPVTRPNLGTTGRFTT